MAEPLGAGWSDPPFVEKGAFQDFADMAGEGPYEGMSLGEARRRFAENDLDWDTLSPQGLRAVIRDLARSDEYSQLIGPACFVFCDHKIPEQHRLGWVVAVMAARDVHEGD